MTTGEFAQTIKKKYPQYVTVPDEELAQRMLTKYPQYKSQVTPETKLTDVPGNAVKDIGGIIQGTAGIAAKMAPIVPAISTPTNAITSLLFNPGVRKTLADTATEGSKGTLQEYGSLISNPKQHAMEHPVNTIMDILPLLAGAKAAYGKIEPRLNAGEKVGKAVDTAQLPDNFNQRFQQHFGTENNPNPDLFTKANIPAGDVAKYLPTIREFMIRKGRIFTGENPEQPVTMRDLFNERQALRVTGKVEKGKLATPEQRLQQAMGGKLSDLMHSLSEDLAKADKAYSQNKQLQAKVGDVGYVAKKAAAYTAIYKLLGLLGL